MASAYTIICENNSFMVHCIFEHTCKYSKFDHTQMVMKYLMFLFKRFKTQKRFFVGIIVYLYFCTYSVQSFEVIVSMTIWYFTSIV